jgi:hypothetical protein
MAEKSSNPKSSRRRKAARAKGGKTTPTKAAPRKRVDRKQKQSPQDKAMLAEARARVKLLASLLPKLRAQIKAERAEAPPNPAELNTNIARAQTEVGADLWG